jgi:hypothetical protein
MRDLRVETEQLCLEPPNHILMLIKVPFLFLVCCFWVLISTGMCLKLLVISPLGPFTFTYLVFTVTVTKQLLEIVKMLTSLRNLNPFLNQNSSHVALYLLLY